jgi:hypothetical protein
VQRIFCLWETTAASFTRRGIGVRMMTILTLYVTSFCCVFMGCVAEAKISYKTRLGKKISATYPNHDIAGGFK